MHVETDVAPDGVEGVVTGEGSEGECLAEAVFGADSDLLPGDFAALGTGEVVTGLDAEAGLLVGHPAEVEAGVVGDSSAVDGERGVAEGAEVAVAEVGGEAFSEGIGAGGAEVETVLGGVVGVEALLEVAVEVEFPGAFVAGCSVKTELKVGSGDPALGDRVEVFTKGQFGGEWKSLVCIRAHQTVGVRAQC